MKQSIFGLLLMTISQLLISQQPADNNLQFIEVTGSAEMTVVPDEIVILIGIQEFWIEEFNSNTKVKNYKTKVPIWIIENNLIDDLSKIGITKDELEIEDISNYGRYWGKEFLFAKQISVSLSNIEKVNSLFQAIDTKGIKFIRIDELKNNQITEHRKQVKIEALQAAKMKAKYLLESMDKQLGEVISITELDQERNSFWNAQNLMSNTIMETPDSEDNAIQGIKLRFEVKVRFRIADSNNQKTNP